MAVHGTGLSVSLANVAGAIRRAAQATGVSFEYLLATANVESNLNPNAKAATSSATGLFQFIDQTWLATLKRAGPTLGYGHYAKSIVQTPSGHYTVADPSMRNAVLKLRRDPATNAAMAGAFTQRNSAQLRERLGRAATAGELYIAHFLGSAGAAKLITQAATAPATAAAELFPAAASANRAIFYDGRGRARSAGEVYGALVGRFETARARALDRAGGMSASAAGGGTAAAVPDPANTFDAFAMVSAVPVARTAESGTAFHSLFQTAGRREPLSPVLGVIWGAGPTHGVDIPASLRPAPVQPMAGRRDVDFRALYQNASGNRYGLFDGTT